MSDPFVTAVAARQRPLAARLKPDAIGVAQDTVIGIASSAPAATVGITLAGMAAATAYGGGPILLITAVPMLIIANSYRRLNMWHANCGASFEWVGRAISPYLGFLTGWLMIVAYVLGTVAEIEMLGPSVLAVFGSGIPTAAADIDIGVSIGLVMLVIAVIGIRATAGVQVGMAMIEYVILIGIAIAGLVAEIRHHPGTVPISAAWLKPPGIGGQGSATAGFLIAVFVFGGWDGALYVNEEVKHRRTGPGKAAILAVALLALTYTLAQIGLQGAVPAAQLRARSASALVYVAGALGGGAWAEAMALALALSVIAATSTGIVLSARIIYGMASYRALPEFLSKVSRRFATPVAASVLAGLLIFAITAAYLLATSLRNAFANVISVTSLLFSVLYILTALASMACYRRRIFSRPWDTLTLGVLPAASVVFLGWILVKSVQQAPGPQRLSLAGIVAAGLVLMMIARFVMRSPFFAIERESDAPKRRHRHHRRHRRA